MATTNGDADGYVPAAHPPGTVELVSTHRARGEEVVPMPTPSSDPNDPLRWATWRKCLNFTLLSAMTVAIFSILSTQNVFWPEMIKDLNTDTETLSNASAVQLAGLAIGCIFFIPFAEKYGRRSAYIISTTLVTISAWWSAYMKTGTEVYLTNGLMGIAGAVNEAAIQMSIRDMFYIQQRATANGVYFASVKAGAYLTPMAAGAQAVSTGWRSSYITLAGFMTGLTILFIVAFEETKFIAPQNDGTGISKTTSTITGFDFGLDSKQNTIDSETETSSIQETYILSTLPPFPHYLRLQFFTKTSESLWKLFWSPFRAWWLPQVIFVIFQSGAAVCWLVLIGITTSIVFSKEPYNFNSAQLGYMSAGAFIGSICGSLYGGPFVDWAIVRLARRNKGLFEPEMRLYLMPLPSLVMCIGLLVFGITADRGMHWIFPVFGNGLFAFGFGAVADITFTMVIDCYPNVSQPVHHHPIAPNPRLTSEKLVAVIFTVIATGRNALSMIGPFSITPWLKSSSVTNIFIIAACINLGIHLFAIPLAIWGKKSRIAIAPRYYRLSKQCT
ncbi:hypothetical protein CDD82_781 [Ophiocordyceps australis]|uniref:Major facilitator superfamily (MFS) profile domain-containing protein n=1 Tax=Ophiocordyceps australis TaxID=1399860 RepID=A0A2C5ZPT2_9HYPO|nr:hypothetical protein CDD82_781 [Ophiocordyceps australis]